MNINTYRCSIQLHQSLFDQVIRLPPGHTSLIRPRKLPDRARASDERHSNPDSVPSDPAARVILSLSNIGLASFDTLNSFKLLIQRLHVGSRVNNRHQVAQSRQRVEPPVPKTAPAASSRPGCVCVPEKPKKAYPFEETVADGPKDGPLPPQQPRPRSVIWRQARWEVNQQGGHAHECLGDGIAD